jgi:hypothetical protein
MPRITKNNHLQTLQDTVTALSTVIEVLSKDKTKNRREINAISAAIHQIQVALRMQQKKGKQEKGDATAEIRRSSGPDVGRFC